MRYLEGGNLTYDGEFHDGLACFGEGGNLTKEKILTMDDVCHKIVVPFVLFVFVLFDTSM